MLKVFAKVSFSICAVGWVGMLFVGPAMAFCGGGATWRIMGLLAMATAPGWVVGAILLGEYWMKTGVLPPGDPFWRRAW